MQLNAPFIPEIDKVERMENAEFEVDLTTDPKNLEIINLNKEKFMDFK